MKKPAPAALAPLAALALTIAGCGAYHRHPIATTAAIATLAVVPAGICIGVGWCGGDGGAGAPNMDSWQNTAAHYGVAQISVLAAIAAGLVLAVSSPDADLRW